MAEWYVRLEGDEQGPMSAARLKSLADTGRISRATYVRIADSSNWVPAAKVRGLFGKEPAKTADDVPQAEYNVSPKTLRESARAQRTHQSTNSISIWIGAAGSALMALAFLLPVVRLPILGGLSYFNILRLQLGGNATVNEIGVAAVIVCVAVSVGVISTLAKASRFFALSGSLAMLSVILTIWGYLRLSSNVQKNVDEMDRNPFSGFAKAIAATISLEFGIALVLVSALLLLAAAFLPTAKKSQ